MHIYEYAASQNIILHQHVSVTAVTIISVSYNENTVSTQRVVKMYDKIIKYATKMYDKTTKYDKKCMIKPLNMIKNV